MKEIAADYCPVCCGAPMTQGGRIDDGMPVRCSDCSNTGVLTYIVSTGELYVVWARNTVLNEEKHHDRIPSQD